jgi:hypothetical protein
MYYQISKHQLARSGPVCNFSLGLELEGKTHRRSLNTVSGQTDILVGIHIPVIQTVRFQLVDSLLNAGVHFRTQKTVVGIHVVSLKEVGGC